MTVEFEIELDPEQSRLIEEVKALKVIREVVLAALLYEHCIYEADVQILLTGDQEIREINRDTRNLDKPTDVLSFPMLEFAEPGDFTGVEADGAVNFHPESGELMLGDIVISVDTAVRQSQEYGHSLIRELAFLTAHSMLHLMGYDHLQEAERAVMEKKQAEILESLGISR